MEEEKNGISIGEIFRVIFSQKWLALILAVAITFVAVLAIMFGYNTVKNEYVSSFSVNLTVTDDGLLEYPSGKLVNYRDFVSKNNLLEVKASDEKFNGIDVDKMYKNGHIGISQSVSETDGIVYTVHAKKKYFSSEEVAEEFIDQIATTPSRQIIKWVKGLSDDAQDSFDEKVGNEQKLEYLNSQLTLISERFEELGGLPSVALAKVESIGNTVTTLTGELHTKYYEPDVKTLQNYVYAVSGLNDELEIVEMIVKNLSNAPGSVVVTGAELATYTKRMGELEQQIASYEKYLDKYMVKDVDGKPVLDANGDHQYNIPETVTESPESKAFTAKLNALLKDVQSLTDTYETDYYESTSLVSYDGTQIKVDGGMGTLMSVLISLVAGVVIAAIVAYIVGWNKQKKAKTGAVESGATLEMISAGAHAQAAVTEDKPEDKKD